MPKVKCSNARRRPNWGLWYQAILGPRNGLCTMPGNTLLAALVQVRELLCCSASASRQVAPGDILVVPPTSPVRKKMKQCFLQKLSQRNSTNQFEHLTLHMHSDSNLQGNYHSPFALPTLAAGQTHSTCVAWPLCAAGSR